MKTSLVCLALCCLLLPLPMAFADGAKIDLTKLPPAASRKIDFRRDVEPILQRACVSCHGAAKQRGGLRLDDGELALRGSNTGPVLVPGKAVSSRLLHVVAGLDPEVQMPPKGKQPLSASEIGTLRAWIDQGALWPRTAVASKAASSTHGAFQPVRRPEVPHVPLMDRVRSPIDAFVLAANPRRIGRSWPRAIRTTSSWPDKTACALRRRSSGIMPWPSVGCCNHVSAGRACGHRSRPASRS